MFLVPIYRVLTICYYIIIQIWKKLSMAEMQLFSSLDMLINATLEVSLDIILWIFQFMLQLDPVKPIHIEK